MDRILHTLLLLALSLCLMTCLKESDSSISSASNDYIPDQSQLMDTMFRVLKQHSIDPWYPESIDQKNGGYRTHFSHDWQPAAEQQRMIVTQSRLIWTASVASSLFPEPQTMTDYAAHGVQFLRNQMWDDEYGGFFNLVSETGDVIPNPDGQIIKEAYGNSFAIYGLAAYASATGDQEALDLAIETFQWLEESAYDSEHGGYFNYLERNGTPLKNGYNGTPPKDQNSSIHLLEAFTELYHVWPDPLLEQRLQEMLILIRDTIRTDPGYLVLFSEADWTPISYRDSSEAVREENYYFDHVSFGHDVETAFLMIEASKALGIEQDSTTHHYAKQMVDHSLKTGWDDEFGGFYDGGYYYSGDDTLTIRRKTKTWWAQAEGLNALLMMHNLYPDDPMNYDIYFSDIWKYVNTYLIDNQYGGWYESGLDRSPDTEFADKGHIWKTNYHDARAMLHSISLLQTNNSLCVGEPK